MCRVDGCDNKKLAKGYCGKHYQRVRLYGDPSRTQNPTIGMTIEGRFLFYTEVDPASGCWIWTGSTDKFGYGRISGSGENFKAHRWSYQYYFGKFEQSLHVLHSCDNPGCVNPLHLFLGTHQDNMDDMNNKGRGVYHSGERSWGSKLTEVEVLQMIDLFKAGFTNMKIAEYYHVSDTCIGNIKRGITWEGIGGYYE